MPPAHAARRDEGADQQRVHRQPRRAGHQRRDQDRHQPVARVGDGARGHDAGDGAGEARQQRDEGAAGQPDAAHQAVEQEGRARQVARLLEHQDEEEQDQDLRQEHEHAADAGDDAVDQQAAQRALGQHGADGVAERRGGGLDPAHRRLGPGEHRLEHQEQQQPPAASGPSTGCSTTRSMRSLASVRHEPRPGPGAAGCAARAHGRWRCCARSCRGMAARRLPAAALGRAARSSAASPPARTATVGTTGTPSSRASASASTVRPRLLGQVGHVQRHHAGQAQALHRQHQAQVAAQVGGVDARRPPGRGASRRPRWPNSTSRVTRSSGERGCRL